jgi:hypothetical protein
MLNKPELAEQAVQTEVMASYTSSAEYRPGDTTSMHDYTV